MGDRGLKFDLVIPYTEDVMKMVADTNEVLVYHFPLNLIKVFGYILFIMSRHKIQIEATGISNHAISKFRVSTV